MRYDNSSVRRQDRLLSEERAIRLLQTDEVGEKYAQGSFHRTEVIKLTVESFSGKAK